MDGRFRVGTRTDGGVFSRIRSSSARASEVRARSLARSFNLLSSLYICERTRNEVVKSRLRSAKVKSCARSLCEIRHLVTFPQGYRVLSDVSRHRSRGRSVVRLKRRLREREWEKRRMNERERERDQDVKERLFQASNELTTLSFPLFFSSFLLSTR